MFERITGTDNLNVEDIAVFEGARSDWTIRDFGGSLYVWTAPGSGQPFEYNLLDDIETIQFDDQEIAVADVFV